MAHLFANPLFLYVALKGPEAVLGSFGTWLRGSQRRWVRRAGHKIEAFTVDLPKLFKGEVPKDPQ